MEFLELEKLVTTITVGLVTVLTKYLYDLLNRDKEIMKNRASRVEFIDKVINEREWKNPENRLVVEEAFEQMFGRPINIHEIKILVYSETPTSAIRTYLKYKPVLEPNEKKTKFKYKKGHRPYWQIKGRKIQKTMLKGLSYYFLFGFAAAFGMAWLVDHGNTTFPIGNLVLFWMMDIIIWLIATLSLIEGLKYVGCERDLLRDLGEKFDSRINAE